MNNKKMIKTTLLVFAAVFAVFTQAAQAAAVNYTIAGTLSLVSGDPDPLGLNGKAFNVTVALDSTTTPSPFTTTSTQSAGTFTSGTANPVVATIPGLLTATCGGSTPSATINLTDNVTGKDGITIQNCTLLTLYGLVANIQVPAGSLVTAVPAAFPQVSVTGQATFTPTSGGAATRFDLTNATAVATGAPAPVVTPSPTSWSPTGIAGSATALTQAVTFSASAPVSYLTSTSGGAWLAVSPTSGNSSGAGYVGAGITITANPSGLVAGTYGGTVTLANGGTTIATIPVNLTLGAASTVTVTPPSLTYSYQLGGTAPAAQTVSVTASSAVAVSLGVTGGNWLSATASGTQTPATVTVTVNTTGLTAGTYTGTVTISTPGGTPSSTPVGVTLTVSEAAAVPTISGISDGAGFKTDLFAPGSIISIFGSGMGPDPYVQFTLNSTGGLDTKLADMTVTVDGAPAIPLLAWNQQVNAIIPYSAKTSGQAAVVVEYKGAKSAAFNIPMGPAAFKLFAADATGKGPGALLNQDFSVNTATIPADKGSVVQLFGAGGGALSPAVTEGGVAGTALSNIVAPYSATVNGVDSKVWYAGTAPGLVFGVYQVNVQLPADVATGSANIVVKVGDSQSQSDITVFVK